MAESEKKEQSADVMTERFLQTRSIMLSGSIDKESAEKVIKQLLILENISDRPPSRWLCLLREVKEHEKSNNCC